jgi:hypothetical protein
MADSSTPRQSDSSPLEERIAGTNCYQPLTWISAPAGEEYSQLDTSLKKKLYIYIWTRRLPTEQEIPGSSPGRGTIL